MSGALDQPVPPRAGGPFHSGFACFVGRPNVGKSTLVNALVGSKVAITSPRPQTTRHAVRGVLTRPDAQLVLVDTPGLHRPRTLLGQRLNDIVHTTLAEVDVVGFCVPADEKVGPGDRYLAAELRRLSPRTPVVAVVTKADLVGDPDVLGAQLLAVAGLGDWAEVVPVSAVTAHQLGLLGDLLVARLPVGPLLYPEGQLTDEPESVLIAEFVREAALEGVREELPHSLAVTVEEMLTREETPGVLDVYMTVWVERASQKAIVIGRGGQRLKQVGTTARRQIEELLGTQIYLDLHVKVAKDWQRNPKQLRRLGF
ncbi:MAG: GTPase Era [Frankiaceae bacterium]